MHSNETTLNNNSRKKNKYKTKQNSIHSSAYMHAATKQKCKMHKCFRMRSVNVLMDRGMGWRKKEVHINIHNWSVHHKLKNVKHTACWQKRWFTALIIMPVKYSKNIFSKKWEHCEVFHPSVPSKQNNQASATKRQHKYKIRVSPFIKKNWIYISFCCEKKKYDNFLYSKSNATLLIEIIYKIIKNRFIKTNEMHFFLFTENERLDNEYIEVELVYFK